MPTKRERTDFGHRLFQARTRANLTQPQLAKAVGMAQSTLGELEYIGRGSSFTSQIAKACGVNPEWLASGEGPMALEVDPLLPEIADVAAAINQLPQKQRDWVLRNVRDAIELARETLVLNANALGAPQGEENTLSPQNLERRVKGRG